MSLPKRLVEFLNDAADDIPGRYIPKPLVCKVVFMLPKVPGAESRHVKDELRRICGTAKRVLWHTYKRDIYYDRLEGMRASYDETDRKRGSNDKERRKFIRVKERFAEINAGLDVRKLDAQDKADVLADRRALKLIDGAVEKLPLPQLPAARKPKKK
jgi:hypothetical protein